MKLDDLPAGRRVFVDANIFIYHFTGQSSACRRLLERCESGQVKGFCGVHVVLEVLHRLMMIEAVHKGLVTPGNVARKLKAKPQVISTLEDYQQQAARVPSMGVAVLGLDLDLVLASRSVQQRFGLLTLDSVTVAMMEREAVSAIATLDADFARVVGIDVFEPELT